MKTLNLSSLLLLLSLSSWAQSWTFGPRLNAPMSIDHDNTSVKDGQTNLSLGSMGEQTPVQWGVFARYDRQKFYALGEIATGRFSSGGYINRPNNGRSFSIESQLVGGTMQAGVKVVPWLRLYGGVGYQRHIWKTGKWDNIIQFLEQKIVERPTLVATNDRDDLAIYRLLDKTYEAYNQNVVTGHLGAGVDIGKFTLDLAYRKSITPLLDGIPTATGTLPARQGFGSYMLTFGYRLLPLKTHTLAPQQKRAYERITRDVPFYRNEFHASIGLLGESVGSGFYENRYTRYVRRRLGITAGLNVMRLYDTMRSLGVETPWSHYNAYQLVTGVRVLPLYSRRHTLGLTAGPTLTYETGIRGSVGSSQTINGVTYSSVNWRRDSRQEGLKLNWQATLDYHFAPTDRLLIGPWLRINGLYYGAFGFQAGYRF